MSLSNQDPHLIIATRVQEIHFQLRVLDEEGFRVQVINCWSVLMLSMERILNSTFMLNIVECQINIDSF